MSTFLVSSRSAELPKPSQKRRTRAQRRWYAILQYMRGVFVVGGIFGLTLSVVHSQLLFILLPVGISLIVTSFASRSHPMNRRSLLLAAGIALIYFGGITGWELLTHGPSTPEIIVVTTTLAVAAIFEPGRAYLQAFLEQRFQFRDDVTARTIEAFTSMLRQEIELNGVRERFLTVIQQTMQPQHLSLWVFTPSSATEDAPKMASLATSTPTTTALIAVDDGDPFIAYALGQSGVIEIERVHLASPVLRRLKRDETEIVLPLVSESELLGLLALSPRLNNEEYGREERRVLDTLATQVSSALRVAYMVLAQQAQVRERERIEQELRTARTIQHTFILAQRYTLAARMAYRAVLSARARGRRRLLRLPGVRRWATRPCHWRCHRQRNTRRAGDDSHPHNAAHRSIRKRLTRTCIDKSQRITSC